MRTLVCAFVVVAMVVAGCGDDVDDAATATTAPSGSDEAATTAGANFDVMFDGEVCAVTGPESVPAGEYTLVLTITSSRQVPTGSWRGRAALAPPWMRWPRGDLTR